MAQQMQKMSREARNSYRKANNIRRRNERRKQAEDRQAERNKRSIEEQMILLCSRPGNAMKERSRLLKKLIEK